MSNPKQKILDGNWLSSILQKEIRTQVEELKSQVGRVPGLAVVLVGDNPASRSYVKRKSKVAENKCGFITKDYFLREDSSDEKLAQVIEELNLDSEIDGILLQLPLPERFESNRFIDLISPNKDVDGLSPVNQGLLLRGEGELRPCTPCGVLSLIDLAYSNYISGEKVSFSDISKTDLSGQRAVVIGRSLLVGKPLAALLLERNATVSVVHSRTKDIEEICADADILVAAVGREKLVKAGWVKEGAVIIDVGINRNAEAKLVGDVDYKDVFDKVSAITPVPGGVGPMTVAMLMKNTLNALKKSLVPERAP